MHIKLVRIALKLGANNFTYLLTFNFNVQRQLPGNAVFEIGYLTSLGHKLNAPGSRSINQVDPTRIGPGNAQALRPFPQFSDVRVISPTIGNSNYHGVNFRIEKRHSSGIQFNANYTWSKAIDDVESRNELGGNAGDLAFANQYDRAADRGLSGNHIGHRFRSNSDLIQRRAAPIPRSLLSVSESVCRV